LGAVRALRADHEFLPPAGTGLRGADQSGVFAAQPLGLLPDSDVFPEPARQARRVPHAGPFLQRLSGVRGDADGRPRRNREPHRSGQAHRQEPLRSAAGRGKGGEIDARLACAGARCPRSRSRFPAARRRFHQGRDRDLAQLQAQEGGRRHRAAAAPLRIPSLFRHLSATAPFGRRGRIKSMTRSPVLLPLVAACFIAIALPTRADDFYRGKTFTVVVGFSPGGGYDLNARAVARHLAKHIPGNPTVIVQNMPGAGSLTSVRHLDASAPKDGTVMTAFNGGLVTQSIVQPERVNLDFRKVAWVGVVSPEFRVCYGFGPAGVKSWDELMRRKQFVIGSTGKASNNYINGATLREVFHAPIKQILGFPGSAEQRLAIE